MPGMDNIWARNLTTRRQALGLSQRRLATLAGLSNESVSAYESGRYKPRPDAQERLAKALHTSRFELFPPQGNGGDAA